MISTASANSGWLCGLVEGYGLTQSHVSGLVATECLTLGVTANIVITSTVLKKDIPLLWPAVVHKATLVIGEWPPNDVISILLTMHAIVESRNKQGVLTSMHASNLSSTATTTSNHLPHSLNSNTLQLHERNSTCSRGGMM